MPTAYPECGPAELYTKTATVVAVRFLGFVRDVPALLSRLDLFCLPARREALPPALLEACPTGRPVSPPTSETSPGQWTTPQWWHRRRTSPRSPTRSFNRLANLFGHEVRQMARALSALLSLKIKKAPNDSRSGHSCCSITVVRGGVEPPTFRFSGGRSYRLSYLTSVVTGTYQSGPDGT